MKKYIAYISAVFILLVVVSCVQKECMPSEGKELVIGVAGLSSVSVSETKATAVTSLPSTLYWGATSGTRGAIGETRKWNASSGSVVGSTLPTGQFVTVPEVLNYYVSNHSFTVPATGNITMAVDNSMDVVAGWTASATDSNTPSVTLNHIFARTGTLTLNLPYGYSASGVSWSIKGNGALTGTAGTYNLSTGAWTASSASLDYTTITSGSDLYLLPGDYDVKITFTATRGGFSKTYTQVGTVTMEAGKRNNITASSSSDDSTEIIISLSLTPWDELPLIANIGPHKYSFGGLEIASGNLHGHLSSTNPPFSNYSQWNGGVLSYDDRYTFSEAGQIFDSAPFNYSANESIENNLNPVDDWRLPTEAEWLTITLGDSPGTSRPGSTVNGHSGVKFAIIVVNDLYTSETSFVSALLLFPDNEIITGHALNDYSNRDFTNANTFVTFLEYSDVAEYVAQGCAVLPAEGHFDWDQYEDLNVGLQGFYLSSTSVNGAAFSYLNFLHFSQYSPELGKVIISNLVRVIESGNKLSEMGSIRLVREID